jgi:hypothetical protein
MSLFAAKAKDTLRPGLRPEDWPDTAEGWTRLFDEQYATGKVDEAVRHGFGMWVAFDDVTPPVQDAARKIASALGYDPDEKRAFGLPAWFQYKQRAEDELIAIALGRPLEKRR